MVLGYLVVNKNLDKNFTLLYNLVKGNSVMGILKIHQGGCMKKYFVLLVLPIIIFAIWDEKWLDINRWRCPFYNDGRYGYDDGGGATWPYPLQNRYIFGAGVWIGCISSDSIVSLGYNPNTAQSEMVPTLCCYWRQGYANTLDRIYKYPGDWPAPISRFPMAPQISRSNEDLWCCFSDSDPSYHTLQGTPIGIDVALTVYGFSDAIAQDFFYLKYDLINPNNYPLNNLYFGLIFDGDIGDGTDDMVGLIRDRYFTVGSQTIRVKNTGFMYDYDHIEIGPPVWAPGAVAIRLISAPSGLTMSAFKKFTVDFDPLTDRQQYQTLAGYNYQTGAYEPFDSIDITPGDKRFLLSTGPFNLAPLSTVIFSYAVIATPYGGTGAPPYSDTVQLAWQSYLADSIFRVRILGIEDRSSAPTYKTINIHPNPFSSHLQIFSSANEIISVEVYNVNGSLVKTLSGNAPLFWNGEDEKSKKVPSGIYFLKLSEQGKTTTHKILLLRN
jgi:hypothetical protein